MGLHHRATCILSLLTSSLPDVTLLLADIYLLSSHWLLAVFALLCILKLDIKEDLHKSPGLCLLTPIASFSSGASMIFPAAHFKSCMCVVGCGCLVASGESLVILTKGACLVLECWLDWSPTFLLLNTGSTATLPVVRSGGCPLPELEAVILWPTKVAGLPVGRGWLPRVNGLGQSQ